MQASVLCLTALGLSLVFGVMRVVNVAHGEFYMIGAVLCWWITSLVSVNPAVNFAVAMLCAPVLVAGIAALSERFILRRLEYDPESTIVATIGILFILQQSALIFFGPDARPVDAPFYFRVDFPWFGYHGIHSIHRNTEGLGHITIILGGAHHKTYAGTIDDVRHCQQYHDCREYNK